MLLGWAGVLAFSLTLPATRAAGPVFGALTLGIGRAVVAGILATALLLVCRQPVLPPPDARRRIGYVIAGVVIGFPLFTSIALLHVESGHGAVVTGLLPAATAGVAVLRAGERPRPGYWVALAVGLAAVVAFAVVGGAGRMRLGDVLLLAAVVVGGLGYAEGAVLARTHGGWRVICWALVVALPLTVPVTVIGLMTQPVGHVTGRAVAGLVYVSVVSMFLGFFAWYKALALGGVAKIGSIQLAQPVLTLGWSAVLLGEHITAASAVTAAVVLAVVFVGRKARVDRVRPDGTTGPAAGDPRQPLSTES
jgi:drug/metabolite transporter (DMT)-like permease